MHLSGLMRQWESDQDAQLPTAQLPFQQLAPSDVRFGQMVDRLFTSCDCCDEHPEGLFELFEAMLRSEVALFHHILFSPRLVGVRNAFSDWSLFRLPFCRDLVDDQLLAYYSLGRLNNEDIEPGRPRAYR